MQLAKKINSSYLDKHHSALDCFPEGKFGVGKIDHTDVSNN